jgi:hypothetical protein
VLIPPPALNGAGVPEPEPDAELLFNADIEPDADGDGHGDETRDLCPQRASVWRQQCVLPFGLMPPPGRTAEVGKARL